jgi:uncharacterized protein (TIGR04141 family)
VKINIFCIPEAEVEELRTKLCGSGMSVIKEVDQNGWHGEFYYSKIPLSGEPSWVESFREYFDEVGLPSSRNHYAAFVFTKNARCFVLSFGKSHFFIRPHCDYDFGIELAKRIADDEDTRQTASRRFQGKKTKDIKSFANNTRLDFESGESVDFIQASIIIAQQDLFGKAGKFGTSALLTPDITASELGTFLTNLEGELAKEPNFTLPRTTLISEPDEVAKLDELLLDQLTSGVGTTVFTHNTYDLYGVDFVFSSEESFVVSCPGEPRGIYEALTIKELKAYISDNRISREDILKIKIRHLPDGSPPYTKRLKESVDFIADKENIVLTNGRWMRFNQDYIDFLDEYLRGIEIEVTESQFLDITIGEPEFNRSPEIKAAGYEVADRDFTIFRTRSATPIEAWDLKLGGRVYAVKFGTPQKLGYVCDQATAVLELLRNRAEASTIPGFRSYCLWFGYRGQNRLDNIASTGSIILKQKIETWARKARDLGIEPVIKISRKLKPGVDV